MSRVSHKKCPKNAEKGRKFRNWCQISFVQFIISIVSLHLSLVGVVGRGEVQVGVGQVHREPESSEVDGERALVERFDAVKSGFGDRTALPQRGKVPHHCHPQQSITGYD